MHMGAFHCAHIASKKLTHLIAILIIVEAF